MIVIGNISEINPKIELFDEKIVKIDEAYGIVRNPKNKTWLKNIPDLAPSSNLYNFYLSEKKNFTWTQEKFKTIFLPRYINEIKNIQITFPKDKNIFLGCFCENEKSCHRLLLGLYLKLLGYDVKSTSLNLENYKEYLDEIEKILKGE